MQQEAEFQTSLFINVITSISPWWYPLLAPIALLSTWGPFFALAYSTTLSIQIQNIIDTKPQDAKKFVLIRLLIGILILAISKAAGTIFSYRFFESGHFIIPTIGIYNWSEVLDLIAWSGFIVPTVIWLFYGRLKVKNPHYLILILFAIIVIWIGISPSLTNLGETYVLPWLTDRDLHFLRYLVSKMIRGRFRIFPTLVFGYLGGIYGTMLYHKFTFKKILYATLILFGICIAGFLLWHFLIEPDWFQNFASEAVPMPLQIFNIGAMPFIVLLFLHNQDFAKTEKKRVRAAKRTTWWRRYSLISLTAYSLGTEIGYRIYKFFTDVWGPSVDRVVPSDPSTFLFAWNFWQLIAFIFTMWIFWEILLRLWEKIRFAFSVDWLLVKTTQLLTGQKMARMNLKPIIYGPNKFQEDISEEKEVGS
jgi:hypothetical protein